MDSLARLINFTETGLHFPGPFHRDPDGKLFLLFDVPPEGVQPLIDGKIAVGGLKSTSDLIRIALTVHQGSAPALLLEEPLSLSHYGKEIEEFLTQESQYLAFFYRAEKKRFFVLAKKVTLDTGLKKSLLSMKESSFPAIHQVPLSQWDLESYIPLSYTLYRLQGDLTESPSLLHSLREPTLFSSPFALWTGSDGEGSFLLSNILLSRLTVEKENISPLKTAALPYAFSRNAGEIFRIIIDSDGWKRLKKRGCAESYEKNYPFWA